MRRFFVPILAAMLAVPVFVSAQLWSPPSAQTDEAAPKDGVPEDGTGAENDPFAGGLENFMQNMLNEAAPHLDKLSRDLGDIGNSLRPVLGDIGKLMDDVKNYQAPERLENGDILIRRRADAPPPPPVGNALREMLRPAPEDDPSLPRSDEDRPRVPDRVLPETDPASEIEL